MIIAIIFYILINASLVMLIAYPFLIIFSTKKAFILTYANSLILGAYLISFFQLKLSFSFLTSFSLSLLFIFLLALAFELTIYKVVKSKGLNPLSTLLVSLGMYIIVQNLISFVWGDEVIKLGNNSIIVGNNILGAYVTNIQMLTFAICVILIITILIFLEFNTIGLIIRGVSANEELSNIQGINSNIIILYTICICSCIGSIAGVLISFDTGITPSIGFTLLLYGVIAMIIGGVGSTWGLIGGALLVATAQQLTAYFIDIKWIDAVTNLILIFFLILKPLGISGKHLKKTEI